jgi:hypothetical protein
MMMIMMKEKLELTMKIMIALEFLKSRKILQVKLHFYKTKKSIFLEAKIQKMKMTI